MQLIALYNQALTETEIQQNFQAGENGARTDEHGIPFAIYDRLGLDPEAGDSDGDGLSDAFELQNIGVVDPTITDTNGDATPDDGDDSDGDGLIASTEQSLGTSAQLPDTDDDELLDSEEGPHGTDPLLADTDGDGLADGVEVRLGTNPLVADSDSDGTGDGEAVLVSPAVENEPELDMDLRGVGDLTEALSVARSSSERPVIAAGGLLRSYDIDLDPAAEPAFTDATLRFSYDPAELGIAPPTQLAVLYFDETVGIWRDPGGSQVLDQSNSRT